MRRLQSPATFETPQEVHRDAEDEEEPKEIAGGAVSPTPSWQSMKLSSSITDEDVTRVPASSSIASSSSKTQKSDKSDKMGLDKFLAVHTSEDNESFTELMEESREEFKRTHEWMFKKDEQLSIESKKAQLALPSPEDQADQRPEKASGSTSVDKWTYKNINAVF